MYVHGLALIAHMVLKMAGLSPIFMLLPLMATAIKNDFYFRSMSHNSYCQNPNALKYDLAIRQCGKELLELLQAQFPWMPVTNSTASDYYRTMDPTDQLRHICTVFRYTMNCIRARLGGVEEGCLQYGFSGKSLEVTTTLSFLCDRQDRLATMRSIKCLWDTRILSNLQFRSWKKCGKEIFSQQSNAMKNALFLVSDRTYLSPLSELLQKIQKSLYCVSNNSIHCFLSGIVDPCGDHAKALIRDYFARFQKDLMNVWQLQNVTKDMLCAESMLTREYNYSIRQKNTDLALLHPYRYHRRGERTGLQTNHGRMYLSIFHNLLSRKGLCSVETVDIGYRILVYSLFVNDVPIRFNLFHMAHGLTICRPYNVPCYTGDFTVIEKKWTIWRNICPAVRSQVYPLTVLLDGCRLYELFDSQFHSCGWEDILIRIYATAAAISRSPNTGHWLPGGSNYLLLDGMYEYYSIEQWAGYTRRALWVIRNSLDEVTLKCGANMTSALIDFYYKLEYSLFDSIIHRKSLNS